MSTRHLRVVFAVMFAICCPKESVRSSVTPRNFSRGVKRSGWHSRWIVGCNRAWCKLLVKKCHLIFLYIERHLVMPVLFRDAGDGFLHDSLSGQLGKITAEQGDVICKHCDFNAIWYNGLQIVDIE